MAIKESYVKPIEVKAAPVITSDDESTAKAFIYQHESGNVACKINGGAIDCNYNGNRACGIGQALPCQKLTAICNLSDYACQDNWFTNYMKERYGSWSAAKQFWQCIGMCSNKYGTTYKANTWW